MTVFGYGSDGELRVVRGPELSGYYHVKVRPQGLCDFGRHHDPASGEPHYDWTVAAVFFELFGEELPGLFPVSEYRRHTGHLTPLAFFFSLSFNGVLSSAGRGKVLARGWFISYSLTTLHG